MPRFSAYLLLAALLALAFPLAAQQSTSAKLAEECRQEHITDSSYSMVWVFPTEYWTLSYREKGNMSEAEIQRVVEWMSPYTLVLIADGSIAPLGNVVYRTKTELSQQLSLTAGQTTAKPLKPDEINEQTRAFVAVMKPVIAQMLAMEAKNIHFVLFPAAPNEKPLIEPKQKGSFTLHLRDLTFSWRTPFAAITPAKRCPIDGEEQNGSWEFCPWHGVPLMEKK